MSLFKSKDNTEIFYREAGDGSPVILIHGWPVNGDMWDYQRLELLRRGHRVITYDRRGFGRSEQPGEGYDYNTFADDLNSLIEHLDLQDVALVGFSMGGGEIARYLSRYGADRVASTVLISAVTPYMLKDGSNPDGVEPKVFAEMISNIEEDRPAFLTAFGKQFYGVSAVSHPVSQETLQWTSQMALVAGLKGMIDCVTAFGKTDFRADMAAFTIPTLIIHGTADKTVPINIAGEAASKLIPSAKFLKYDGAPHGLFITHKQKLNEDLCAFLEANRPATSASNLARAAKKTDATANSRNGVRPS